MAMIAIAIRAESPGPVLFRQKRIGHAGKRITVYKFRTMRPVEVEDERLAAMTSDGDERITRVGKWLRYLRVDELVPRLRKIRIGAIGPVTAHRLAELGVPPTIIPETFIIDDALKELLG